MSHSLAAADRAHLLAWLSSVFLREPDAGVVGLLAGDEGDQAIAALDAAPALAAEARAMIVALRAVRTREGNDAHAALALAGRFGTLFLGAGGPKAAHPYASVYEEGRTHGAATERAVAFLATHDLSVGDGLPEPADHLGIQLAALATLAEREALADDGAADAVYAAQAAFAATDMRPWLGTFRERVARDDPDGYYAAAARLTEAALEAFYAPARAS